MIDKTRSAAPALRRPLCRRYMLGIFDAAAVKLRDSHGELPRRTHWAFGWLRDDDCEFLGAWMDGPHGLPQMLADLRHRGVLRIQTVLPPAGASHEQGGLLSDTVTYPFVGELVVRARAASYDRVPPSAQLVAARVRAVAARAIARHGSFESEAAVLDFMAGVLQRAERRLDRERSIATAGPRGDPGAGMATGL